MVERDFWKEKKSEQATTKMQSEGCKNHLFLQVNLMKHLVKTKNSTWILKIPLPQKCFPHNGIQ